MFFCSLAFSEDFNLICEGERKVRNLSSKEFNVTNFESILLKINKNSMDYIGLNSGRSYFLSNREYTAPKRPPHEDIKITEQYEYSTKKISVLNIAPGPFKTRRVKSLVKDIRTYEKKLPTGKIGNPDEIGKFVRFVLENKIKYLTGSTIYFDGNINKGYL